MRSDTELLDKFIDELQAWVSVGGNRSVAWAEKRLERIKKQRCSAFVRALKDEADA